MGSEMCIRDSTGTVYNNEPTLKSLVDFNYSLQGHVSIVAHNMFFFSSSNKSIVISSDSDQLNKNLYEDPSQAGLSVLLPEYGR